MKQGWNVTVWGVRGSAPNLSPDCMGYGGNTSCISLEHDGHIVVLDAGTGLTALGTELAARPVRQLDILLSHVHLDHVLGLTAFRPLLDPDAEIHLYGGPGLEGQLRTLIAPPFWPLGIQDYPARLSFHEMQPGDGFALDGLTVSTMAGNHPGDSLLYRLDGVGKRLTYALDCETDERTAAALAGFARDSGLLIWDANFTPDDLRPGWGHSTWEQGLKVGRAANVRQVLMTHYGRDYTDAFLRRQEQQAGQDGLCLFAKEGMEITL